LIEGAGGGPSWQGSPSNATKTDARCGLVDSAFSIIVGTIYDCALDPALWPKALREVCLVSNFAAGTIDVTELSSRSNRFRQYWNYDPYWVER